jgi:uncharacterized phiE125 gp8 family phage protein
VNRFGLQLVTAATFEAVSLSEAKAHLYVDVLDHDADISTKLSEAQTLAERECGRQFCLTTLKLFLDEFPASRGSWESDCVFRSDSPAILLPLSPLRSVTSVKYYNEAGVLTTVSPTEYWVAVGSDPGRIVPKQGWWPATEGGRPEAVEVEFTAGWPTSADVPADIRGAIKVILADLWENRGDGEKQKGEHAIPPVAARVLSSYRAHLYG